MALVISGLGLVILDVVLNCCLPTKGCAVDADASYYQRLVVSMGYTTLFCAIS